MKRFGTSRTINEEEEDDDIDYYDSTDTADDAAFLNDNYDQELSLEERML